MRPRMVVVWGEGIRALHKQEVGVDLRTLESSQKTEQRTVQPDNKLSLILYHIKEYGIEKRGREPSTS